MITLQNKFYAGFNENENNKSVSFIMVAKENEDNHFVLLINFELQNKAFYNMDSSLSSKIMLERFIMIRIFNNFRNFIFNNFFQDRVFFTQFFDASFAIRLESERIAHFNELKNSLAEEYFLPDCSFSILFNSSTCSFLGGSSSTGCQSIFSQNSQSSSVTSPVCLYLLNMSCFNSLTIALDINSESSFTFSDLNSCILIKNNSKYLNVCNMLKSRVD